MANNIVVDSLTNNSVNLYVFFMFLCVLHAGEIGLYLKYNLLLNMLYWRSCYPDCNELCVFRQWKH